jgi:PAS domain S-box-containing protein
MISGVALHEIICDEAGKPMDYRFLNMNAAFENMTGLKDKDMKGKNVTEVLPDTEAYWIETYGQVALTGKPIQFENYSKELDKHFEVKAYCPKIGQFVAVFNDITDKKAAEQKQNKLIVELQKAANEIKTLKGIIPICSHCKKIRDDSGYWNILEAYIQEHSEAALSHSICPECAERYYPDMNLYDN